MPANFSVTLLTADNQVIVQTNGVAQWDANGEYAFEADLNIPDETLTNLDYVLADVQAQPLDWWGNPDTNRPTGHMVVPYMIDQTRFRGLYNTVGWCSINYGTPSPGWNIWSNIHWVIWGYSDAFMADAANSVLTDIGMLFQYGFVPAVPDPYVLSLIPAYKFTGTPAQYAHFSDVLTNSLYMGINFVSHTTGGVSLFDDNLDLRNLSTDAGNRAGYFLPGGSHGGALTNYYSYRRRMDVWFEGACLGGWRISAGLFGTPQEIDQTRVPIKPTVAFGYDADFHPISCSPHFKDLGSFFYYLPLGSGNLTRASEAAGLAYDLHSEAWPAKPSYQGNPNKTCAPNR